MVRRLALAVVTALALVGCASTPVAGAGQVERLQQLFVQAMPLGPLLERIAANDPNWPLQKHMDRYTREDVACLRAGLTREKGDAVLRQRAADYAARHADRLADDIALLDSGVVRGLSASMGATMTGQPSRKLDADEIKALVEFLTAPAYQPLRAAMYLDSLESAFLAPRSRSFETGRRLGARMMVPLLADAMTLCGVEIDQGRSKKAV